MAAITFPQGNVVETIRWNSPSPEVDDFLERHDRPDEVIVIGHKKAVDEVAELIKKQATHSKSAFR